MSLVSEADLVSRLKQGKLIETKEQMSPQYLEGIIRILTVSADTELISAPAYYLAAQDAPTINAFVSAMGIIQDELGHAHIAYRILEDLGVDKDQLIYDRSPEKFKYPYAFDVPLETWVELVVANAFYDRAGFILLGDVFKHGKFGPKSIRKKISICVTGKCGCAKLSSNPAGGKNSSARWIGCFP